MNEPLTASKYTPKAGTFLMGSCVKDHTHWNVIIHPSNQAGFYFVNVMSSNYPPEKNDGATLDGTTKAIRSEGIERMIDYITLGKTELLKWNEFETIDDPWSYNQIMFFSHEHCVDEVILGKEHDPATLPA
jgi:hypothetical protein